MLRSLFLSFLFVLGGLVHASAVREHDGATTDVDRFLNGVPASLQTEIDSLVTRESGPFLLVMLRFDSGRPQGAWKIKNGRSQLFAFGHVFNVRRGPNETGNRELLIAVLTPNDGTQNQPSPALSLAADKLSVPATFSSTDSAPKTSTESGMNLYVYKQGPVQDLSDAFTVTYLPSAGGQQLSYAFTVDSEKVNSTNPGLSIIGVISNGSQLSAGLKTPVFRIPGLGSTTIDAFGLLGSESSLGMGATYTWTLGSNQYESFAGEEHFSFEFFLSVGLTNFSTSNPAFGGTPFIGAGISIPIVSIGGK